MARSIVDIKNMGDALRNTGYKNIEKGKTNVAKTIYIYTLIIYNLKHICKQDYFKGVLYDDGNYVTHKRCCP